MTDSHAMPARTPATSADRTSVGCRLCAWLCDRFCPDLEARRDAFWEASHDWERACSNDYELWAADSDPNRALAEQAIARRRTDRQAAFHLFLEAAEAGSVWSMEVVGWYYDAVDDDFARAQEYYYRALCGGSWMATIRYARLLEKHGYHDDWPGVLEDGVRANFIPAYFWLAWLRYKRSRTRKTCREVRPILEAAAREGHPAAQSLLGVWMLLGKFGLKEIPAGFRRLGNKAEQPGAAAAQPLAESTKIGG